ncbi:hypothetical protein Ancab_040284 [Ancistrocladus abbreviatus]
MRQVQYVLEAYRVGLTWTRQFRHCHYTDGRNNEVMNYEFRVQVQMRGFFAADAEHLSTVLIDRKPRGLSVAVFALLPLSNGGKRARSSFCCNNYLAFEAAAKGAAGTLSKYKWTAVRFALAAFLASILTNFALVAPANKTSLTLLFSLNWTAISSSVVRKIAFKSVSPETRI